MTPPAITAAQVLDAARAAGVMIATAESCTGGLLGAALTAVPGSSDVVDCGFVTYSNDAKMRMLGVGSGTLAAHGAVSEPVAAEMAAGALERSKSQIAVAITDLAPGDAVGEQRDPTIEVAQHEPLAPVEPLRPRNPP